MSDTLPPLQGVIAFLTLKGGSDAADFYARAFGARELQRVPSEDGERLLYCRLELNGGTVMLADDFPEYHGGDAQTPDASQGYPVTMHLQVADCDASYRRAIEAGATPLMPPADMFWGDRYARLCDPFGHQWSIGQTLAR